MLTHCRLSALELKVATGAQSGVAGQDVHDLVVFAVGTSTDPKAWGAFPRPPVAGALLLSPV